MTALQKSKNIITKGIDIYKSPVPRWAMWCRNIGIVFTIFGSQIIANPKLYLQCFDNIAIYMVNIGAVATAIFQAFRKQ